MTFTGEVGVGVPRGDVALFDDEGVFSAISGDDFALAIVDEIEQSSHRQAHVGIVN